jgi:drug/metabolite transporter (DMT)-like permease
MILIGNGLLSWAEQSVPSGLAAVLYVAPLWLAFLARVVLGESIGFLTVIGLVLGIVGVFVLVHPSTADLGRLFPAATVVFSAAGWASGTVLSKRLDLPANPFQVAGMQMLAGGALTLLVSLATGDATRLRITDISARSELAYAYLVLVGAVLGFGIFAWLIKSAPIAIVATYGYVNPIVAVIVGGIVLGETLAARELVGGAIVVSGVALIVTAQSRKWAGAPAGAVLEA